jgi:hypothetical protein
MEEIELIDKKNNIIRKVSKNLKVRYYGYLVSVNEIEEKCNVEVIGIIIQENGELDLCLKKKK